MFNIFIYAARCGVQCVLAAQFGIWYWLFSYFIKIKQTFI